MAKRFKYRLERILDLKKYEEQQWEIRLGETTAECMKLKNAIGKRYEQIDRSRSTVDPMDIQSYIIAESYSFRLKQEIEHLSEQLKEKEEIREEVAVHFRKARQNRQVYDNLKTRQADEYKKELIKEEITMLDEISNSMRIVKHNLEFAEESCSDSGVEQLEKISADQQEGTSRSMDAAAEQESTE